MPITIRAMRPHLGQVGTLPMYAEADDRRWILSEGDTRLDLPPGVRSVRVWCTYWWIKVGKAELTVDTSGGGQALIYYAPPRTIYNAGVLGYEPAERPGRSTTWLIYLIAVAAPLLLMAAAFAFR